MDCVYYTTIIGKDPSQRYGNITKMEKQKKESNFKCYTNEQTEKKSQTLSAKQMNKQKKESNSKCQTNE